MIELDVYKRQVQMHQKRQADGEAKQPDCAKELDSGKHADQGNHRVCLLYTSVHCLRS